MEKEKLKIPINAGWLAENGMLVVAAAQLGIVFDPGSANDRGITMVGPDGNKLLLYSDYLLFTLGQLQVLGFDTGPICNSCGKPLPVCEREREEIHARMLAEAGAFEPR